MKIGILTFHRSINNGAIMQSYALSKKLIEQFPDDSIEIIDYQMPKVDNTYSGKIQYYITGDSFVLKAKKIAYYLTHPEKLTGDKEKYKLFNAAIDQFLPLSKKKIRSNDSIELNDYINETYDILVVGSDAIWNYTTRGFPNAYFPDSSLNCKKLSYAASCYGMDYTQCSDVDRDEIKRRLSLFDFIGVRDSATEDFVRWSGCSINPIHTCDPTAFLNINELPVDEDEIKKKIESKGFDLNKPTIGIMGNSDMVKMVRHIFHHDYQLVSLYNRVADVDVQLFDLNPFEWAYMFRFFKLTFTTYFHGTMLSLRNGIPLICIALDTDFSKKHTPKTLDVLTRLGYRDWYFQTNFKDMGVDSISVKAKELIAKNLHDDIINRINIEALSINPFIESIEKIKKNEEK